MAEARFLLDRSVGGRLLVARLRDAEWDVRTLAEEYGNGRAQAMRDEEWIAAGTHAGPILLTKDHRVASRPLEALAIVRNAARVVAIARGNLTAQMMGDLGPTHEQAIHRLALKEPPFVYSLGRAGLTPNRLILL